MAEEPVKPPAEGAPAEPSPATQSPAPTEAAGTPAGGATPPPPPDPNAPLPSDALTDGTMPTVLKPGEKPAPKVGKGGRASLGSVYRRADIMSTIFTFVGAVVAAGIILGGYYYFTHSQKKTGTNAKVTNLAKDQLDKLGSFFSGNSAGGSAEVLTVSSASLFTKRVAVNSDLKVLGGLSVGGTTAFSDLLVDKTSTLAATNIRGALTVVGPTNLQSPAVLGGGATINGSVAVSGNGSFGGSVAAGIINTTTLSVTGTLNLAGHLAITGVNPSAAAESGAGSGATANVDGNDSAGTVTVNTTSVPGLVPGSGSQLVKVIFHTPYAKTPRVVITPVTVSAGGLGYYVIKTSTYFIIATSTALSSNTGYSFDYWVVQ
jgi:hypothetical protein